MTSQMAGKSTPSRQSRLPFRPELDRAARDVADVGLVVRVALDDLEVVARRPSGRPAARPARAAARAACRSACSRWRGRRCALSTRAPRPACSRDRAPRRAAISADRSSAGRHALPPDGRALLEERAQALVGIVRRHQLVRGTAASRPRHLRCESARARPARDRAAPPGGGSTPTAAERCACALRDSGLRRVVRGPRRPAPCAGLRRLDDAAASGSRSSAVRPAHAVGQDDRSDRARTRRARSPAGRASRRRWQRCGGRGSPVPGRRRGTARAPRPAARRDCRARPAARCRNPANIAAT